MLYLIFSDVHANIDALQAMFSAAPANCTFLHLGDVVGYGAAPNEVIELLEDTAGVRGNHDDAVLGNMEILQRFNPAAMMSASWTDQHLSDRSRAYLANLPYERMIADPCGDFHLVHGSPVVPSDFNYITAERDALRAFRATTSRLTFVGHSHLPASFKLSDERIVDMEPHGEHDGSSKDTLELSVLNRYIVNVGSVGQPRDRNALASYVFYDSESQTVSWQRVSYDIPAAQAKIRNAGLPSQNADRLTNGR